MNLNAINSQIQAAAFLILVLQFVGFAIFMWIVYWVTKKAITDAIRESGLIEEVRRAGREAGRAKTDPNPTHTDMRADR